MQLLFLTEKINSVEYSLRNSIFQFISNFIYYYLSIPTLQTIKQYLRSQPSGFCPSKFQYPFLHLSQRRPSTLDLQWHLPDSKLFTKSVRESQVPSSSEPRGSQSHAIKRIISFLSKTGSWILDHFLKRSKNHCYKTRTINTMLIH